MTDATSKHDNWSQGALYEPYIGRWSRLVAREFIQWLGVRNGLRWLDVGCGTGAVTQTILEVASPQAVVAVDKSEGYVEYAREHTPDARATFQVGDAQDLKTERGAYDAVVSGLVLNFVPSPERMVTEMARACRLNGKVATYIWDYADKMQLIRYFWDAAVQLDPNARALDEGVRFPMANAKGLWNLFLDANLNDVTTRAIDVPMHFENFDALWTPFLSGQGAAPGYVMSLTEAQRDALRERYAQILPRNADGSIDLIARAWAVRGTR